MAKRIYQYTLRIWLTTLFASPLVAFLLNHIKNAKSFLEAMASLFLFEGYAIGFGFLFSLPSVIIFYFVALCASKLSAVIALKKVMLTSAAFILLLTTFSFLLKGFAELGQPENLKYFLAYSLILVAALVFYKFPSENTFQPT